MDASFPDRLRDRLYFAFERFHQRSEVVDAVRRGRAVSDPALARAAVERARMFREHRGRFFWIASPWTVICVCLGFLVGAVLFALGGNWILTGVFVVEAAMWPFLYARATRRQMEAARHAEEANEQLTRASAG
jgi:hypothetical protein